MNYFFISTKMIYTQINISLILLLQSKSLKMSSIFNSQFFESNDNVVKTFYPSPNDHNTEYKIINLVDIESDSIHKMENYHWARSAIMYGNSIDKPLDDSDLKVLSVSPPTAVIMTTFKNSHPNCSTVFANEHVEGTMINVFYDPRNQHWEMATKHAIGGDYWFYRTQYGETGIENKSFRTMFVEALGGDVEKSKTHTFLENLLPFLNELPKDYSYSFVLQHPENHIVLNIGIPCVYLVAIYNIGHIIARIHPDIYETQPEGDWKALHSVRVFFPRRIDNNIGYDILESSSLLQSCVGIMFHDLTTGERAVMRNPSYEMLKQLRGNHPNMQYHFYEMLQNGTLPQFMYSFPRYDRLFSSFNAEYIRMIQTVHYYYVQKFILKVNADQPIPKKYFVHIMRLHNDIFRATRQKITIDTVNKYFMDMTPGQLMFYMDYDNRKQQEVVEEDNVAVPNKNIETMGAWTELKAGEAW